MNKYLNPTIVHSTHYRGHRNGSIFEPSHDDLYHINPNEQENLFGFIPLKINSYGNYITYNEKRRIHSQEWLTVKNERQQLYQLSISPLTAIFLGPDAIALVDGSKRKNVSTPIHWQYENDNGYIFNDIKSINEFIPLRIWKWNSNLSFNLIMSYCKDFLNILNQLDNDKRPTLALYKLLNYFKKESKRNRLAYLNSNKDLIEYIKETRKKKIEGFPSVISLFRYTLGSLYRLHLSTSKIKYIFEDLKNNLIMLQDNIKLLNHKLDNPIEFNHKLLGEEFIYDNLRDLKVESCIVELTNNLINN